MRGPTMFQSLLAAVLATTLIFQFPVTPQQSPAAEAKLKRTNPSLALITWEGDEGGVSFCSGFAVGILWVITAEHCAPDGKDLYVDGLPAKRIKKNDMLALLQVSDAAKYKVVKIQTERPKIGDEVTVVGFVYGMPQVDLKRHVAGYCVCEYGSKDNMLMDNPVGNGASGGPIYDAKGDVVALHQASKGVIGLATTAKEIAEFIK